MRRLYQGQWPGGWTKQLTGYPGIFEMRLKVERYQYRPLFIFGPSRGNLTFVVMADEVGNDFVPKDAPDRATGLMREVIAQRTQLHELEIDE
jgi:hypothetical protein